MKQEHTATSEIPDKVLKSAMERLKSAGFKFRLEAQARYMIADTSRSAAASI